MKINEAIFYHRAFRHFEERSILSYIARFLLLTVPFVALMVYNASNISLFFSKAAHYMLLLKLGNESFITSQASSVFGVIYTLTFMGRYPTPAFSFATVVVCCAGMFALKKTKIIPGSISIYLIFILLVTVVSALFFTFFADRFPYSIENFSDFYMKTEFGVWLMAPVVLAISVLALPTDIVDQFLLITVTLLYSIIFGLVRYILFLYMLNKFSYLFMSTMFIAFDPPLDAIYIIGIYSLYVTVVSNRIKIDPRVWKCI